MADPIAPHVQRPISAAAQRTHNAGSRPSSAARTAPRVFPSLALIVVMLGSLAATIAMTGCFGPRLREFTRSPEQFVGPRVGISDSDDQHDIIVYAPSPGYSVTREGLVETLQGVDLFITIRRPDPAFLYTQQIVEQRIATRVPAEEPMRVFARVLDHDQKQSSRPYARVSTAAAGSPAP